MKLRHGLLFVLLASLLSLFSCQSAEQRPAASGEDKIGIVRLTIADWESDGTAARARGILKSLGGVLNLSEVSRIGQVTVTYDQSKVTLEQMEEALQAGGVTVTRKHGVR